MTEEERLRCMFISWCTVWAFRSGKRFGSAQRSPVFWGLVYTGKYTSECLYVLVYVSVWQRIALGDWLISRTFSLFIQSGGCIWKWMWKQEETCCRGFSYNAPLASSCPNCKDRIMLELWLTASRFVWGWIFICFFFSTKNKLKIKVNDKKHFYVPDTYKLAFANFRQKRDKKEYFKIKV